MCLKAIKTMKTWSIVCKEFLRSQNKWDFIWIQWLLPLSITTLDKDGLDMKTKCSSKITLKELTFQEEVTWVNKDLFILLQETLLDNILVESECNQEFTHLLEFAKIVKELLKVDKLEETTTLNQLLCMMLLSFLTTLALERMITQGMSLALLLVSFQEILTKEILTLFNRLSSLSAT